MTPLCGTPGNDHDGPVRPYPCGPRCTRHTPAATAGRDEPPTTPLERTS